MRAIANWLTFSNRLSEAPVSGRNPDKQKRFFELRGWETHCRGFRDIDETPDRWVFVVSLVLLPLVLVI